ncbi:MAG: DsbA family protein [Nocardioidaceae bacterium]
MSSNKANPDRRARAEQMRKERERAAKRRRNGITVGIVVIVVVLIAVAGFGIYQATSNDAGSGGAPEGVTSKGGIVYDQEAATGSSSGDSKPVEVVAYEDFYCPACRAFEEASGDYLQSAVEDGTISVEYRPIAILDRMSPDQYSTRSASASACVMDSAGPEAFYEFHNLLYENQPPEGSPGPDATQLTTFAGEAGADGVSSCIEDDAYEGWVTEQTDAFGEDGYGETPTVLVDGERVPTPSPANLEKAIQAASAE